jgi:3-oxoacyl-[acyl-carrier-protein] synthase-3
MNVAITAISYATGDKKLTSEELASRFGIDAMKKIESISGILQRRVASENVCASDLAFKACELLFEKNPALRDEIDLLIFATQTPDYIMPSTSCIMQDRLRLKKTCASFDINLGCSQFPYAIATASSWITTGLAKKALVINADTPSKLIHPLDKSAITLFGDAGAVVLLEESEKKSFLEFEFGSDGAGFDNLICPASAMRKPHTREDDIEKQDDDGNIRTNANMYINGFSIFAFAYKTIPETITKLLNKASLSIDDIDLFIFHQAGEMMVSSASKRLKIPESKVYFKMHDIGNCGGASIPIALADAVRTGRLKSGMRIVVCAFGVGLSWGATIIDWSDDFKFALTCDDYSDSPSKPQSQCLADA